ncbi:hypothetical protein SDC9_125992 [bioreactor metagenome]|uniref:Uncharacterized protein n=1 Tax=bioreactor metagenome TaxID=1076179 RepID=A0A645CPZ0_9ZZZZ
MRIDRIGSRGDTSGKIRERSAVSAALNGVGGDRIVRAVGG